MHLTYFGGKNYNPIEAIFLQHFSMTRHCLVLQKYLKLKYFILILYKLRHFLNIFLQDQWEKLLAVSICCCIIYVYYKELAIAGCKCFWCYLMQWLDEVGFPTPISNEVCDGIMRPGRSDWARDGIQVEYGDVISYLHESNTT